MELSSREFTILECVGKGAFGEVYQALYKSTSEIVAIKVVDLDACTDDIESIRAEIKILTNLDHQFVTRYYGSFVEGNKLFIVMEFLGGGSLFDVIKYGVLPEEYIAIIMRDCLLGLEMMHQRKLCHRDIKSANILLGENGAVKLADFGVSAQLSETIQKHRTFVGTPLWMAPEVIMLGVPGAKNDGYTTKADIWSLGITAMELACGQPPYNDYPPMQAMMMITQNAAPKLPSAYSKYYSRAFQDFISDCLTKNPNRRPSATELLRHKFIKTAKNTRYLSSIVRQKTQRDNYTKSKKPRKGPQNVAMDKMLQQQERTLVNNSDNEWDWSFSDEAPDANNDDMDVVNERLHQKIAKRDAVPQFYVPQLDDDSSISSNQFLSCSTASTDTNTTDTANGSEDEVLQGGALPIPEDTHPALEVLSRNEYISQAKMKLNNLEANNETISETIGMISSNFSFTTELAEVGSVLSNGPFGAANHQFNSTLGKAIQEFMKA